MNNLTVRVINNVTGFESLKSGWEELLAGSRDRNIYLTWEWLYTWFKHYGADKKLNLALIEDGSRVIGVVPLMVSRVRYGPVSFRLLENIGGAFPDYGGAIFTAREEEAVAALLTWLRDEKMGGSTALVMSQIPLDSQFLPLLRAQSASFRDSLVLSERVITTCPYLPLPKTSDEYLRSLHRKRRGNLRRALESLQQKHHAEFKQYDSGDNLPEAMRLFFELSHERWGTQIAVNQPAEQKSRQFYIDLATTFQEKGWLDFSFLYAQGEPISVVFGFKYRGKFYYSNQTYNPAYAEYSPGSLHALHLIQSAIEGGMTEFDFLKGGEAYKYMWTHCSRDNVQVIVTSNNMAWWGRALPRVMRMIEIGRRGLRTNYRFWLEKRKQDKAKARVHVKDED